MKRHAALGLLLLVGLLVRLPGITDPPVEFHPLRQYHSALIARAWYAHLPWVHSIPRAAADSVSPGVVEPPVMETLAVGGDIVTGGAHIWVGRLLSTLFWLAGAVALFVLARRLAGLAAAYASTVVFVFLPFAIEASRSFQPDPLFIALTLWAVVALLHWDDEPTRRRLLVAAAVASAALFVKVMAVFFVVAVLAVLLVRRRGLRAALTDRDAYLYVAVAALPFVLYLAAGFAFGFLSGEQSERVLPKLWTDASYWRGWEAMVRQVVAAPFLALAALGVLVARGRALAVVLALFAGFVVFGLTFTWHIHTHSYYSLPLVVPVALAIGLLVQAVADRAAKHVAASVVAGAGALAALGVAVYGVHVQDKELRMPRAEAVAVADEARTIGAVAGYPDRTVYLSLYYGALLQYDGYVRGEAWPSASQLDEERTLDGRVTPASERLAELAREAHANRFVLADARAPHEQPDLVRLLDERYERVAEGDGYTVYALDR